MKTMTTSTDKIQSFQTLVIAVDFLEKPLNGLSTQRVIKARPET